MATPITSKTRFFLNKRFYLHVRGRANTEKAAEFIKVFGGQIDQFLETSVSYLLTDIPKDEWPPNGNDETLKRAKQNAIKLMSLNDLISWCTKYLSSQSSSDEDDESKANIKELHEPFIKFEDFNCHYSPTVKEFAKWPEINIDTQLPIGKAIFSDSSLLNTPNQSVSTVQHPNNSAQLTQQAASLRTTNPQANGTSTPSIVSQQPAPLANSNIVNGLSTATQVTLNTTKTLPKSTQHVAIAQNIANKGVRRRHSVYCEICNQRIVDKIEEHILSQLHKSNTEKMNWTEVSGVIASLPKLSTFNMTRLTNSNISSPKNEHQEFLCLHKVESVSQLFNSNQNKDFISLSPLTDRKLVQIQ